MGHPVNQYFIIEILKKSILFNEEFVVVLRGLLPTIFVEVRPRTCNLSAKAKKLFKFSWATLTWPWYMKSKSSFKSSAFTSHNKRTGSIVWEWCNKLWALFRKSCLKIVELADSTSLWARTSCPSNRETFFICSLKRLI